MDPGQNFFTWIGSNFCCSDQVESAIFGLGLALENFPLESQVFQFFALWIKKSHWVGSKLGGPLILLLVKSMLGSGQGLSLDKYR